MIARDIGRHIGRGIGKYLGKPPEGGGVSGFDPLTLGNVIQDAPNGILTGTDVYEASLLGGLAVLKSHEPYDAYEIPLKANTLAFHTPSSSVGTISSIATSYANFTLVAKLTAVTFVDWQTIAWGGGAGINSSFWFAREATGGKLQLRLGSTIINSSTLSALPTGQLITVSFRFEPLKVTFGLNGQYEEIATARTIIEPSSGTILVGNVPANQYYWRGLFSRLGIFPATLTDVQLENWAAGFDALMPVTPLGGYHLDEQSGSTAYDYSGQGRHIALTNATRGTSSLVDFNSAHTLGHNKSGSMIVPRNEAVPANDVLGNPITRPAGFVYPLPINLKVPCLTNHTGTVHIAAPHLSGFETVVSHTGSTTTPVISIGMIDWQSGKTLGEIVLSDGTHYVCQEGPGNSGTNRVVHDVSGAGNHATVTNGTVATIWAGRLTDTQDWGSKHGGRMASGIFIPGLIDSDDCADGQPKADGCTGGTLCNSNTQQDCNPFVSAVGNERGLERNRSLGDNRSLIVPIDTKWFIPVDEGEKHLFTTSSPVPGLDLDFDWTPNDEDAYLEIYYDPNATGEGYLNLTGNLIDSLIDPSGNGPDLESSGTNRPDSGTRTIGTQNVFKYTAASSEWLLANADNIIAQPFVFGGILELDSTPTVGNKFILFSTRDTTGGTNRCEFGVQNNAGTLRFFMDAGTLVTLGTLVPATGTVYRVSLAFNGVGSLAVINGTSLTPSGNPGTNSWNAGNYGSQYDQAAEFFDGTHGKIFALSRAMTLAELLTKTDVFFVNQYDL